MNKYKMKCFDTCNCVWFYYVVHADSREEAIEKLPGGVVYTEIEEVD